MPRQLTAGTNAYRRQKSHTKPLVPGHCPRASPPTPPPPTPRSRRVRNGQASTLLQGQVYLSGMLEAQITAHVLPRSSQAAALTPPHRDRPHLRPGSGPRFWKALHVAPACSKGGSSNPVYFLRSKDPTAISGGRGTVLGVEETVGTKTKSLPAAGECLLT